MRREDGFTLPEVLVAATIGVVVLLASFGLIDTAAPLALKVQDTVDATQRGRLALDQMTSELRSQVCIAANTAPIISADADEVIFYANTGDENAFPEKRRLAFTGTSIVEETWKGTNAAGTTFAASTSRTLVVNAQRMTSPATSVFRYYGFTSTAPVSPTLALTAVPLSAADRNKVVKVSVSFVVRPDRAKAASKRELSFQGSSFTRTSNPLTPAKGVNC
jgi:prepilin-type N-terminal cleavage/methylation domain-containing protein